MTEPVFLLQVTNCSCADMVPTGLCTLSLDMPWLGIFTANTTTTTTTNVLKIYKYCNYAYSYTRSIL
jgi:hypothetical protein